MFEKENVDAVIHCAALKAVGESVKRIVFKNGTLKLLKMVH